MAPGRVSGRGRGPLAPAARTAAPPWTGSGTTHRILPHLAQMTRLIVNGAGISGPIAADFGLSCFLCVATVISS